MHRRGVDVNILYWTKTMTDMADIGAGVSISTVERETGISKDTLRIWERRYGFPQPSRDPHGDRAYAVQDIERLRMIKRLIDHGMRPGKIVQQPLAQLAKFSAQHNQARSANSQQQGEIDRYIRMIRDHQLLELQRSLNQSLLRYGLQTFVTDILTPLNAYVGEAWVCGDLEIFQEHAYTELLQSMLRNAITSHDKSSKPPRLLLATLPKEQHSVGLLMVEAALVVEGVHCISLGAQLPISEIVHATAAHRCDIVALSFTGNYPVKLIGEGLANLRAELPSTVEIWAGGSAIARSRRSIDHVRLLPTLNDAIKEVTQWRQRHQVNKALAS
jgi:MerR family transcriptional regulator, light-induced transcriptional regulator